MPWQHKKKKKKTQKAKPNDCPLPDPLQLLIHCKQENNYTLSQQLSSMWKCQVGEGVEKELIHFRCMIMHQNSKKSMCNLRYFSTHHSAEVTTCN